MFMFFICYIFLYFSCFADYFSGLLVQLIFQSIMTDPLSSSAPAPLNSLLDVNQNINLNPDTTMYGDICNIKHNQID